MKIPEKHQAVMPYLMLDGAAGFIEFTRAVFNATLLTQKMHNGSDKIMHAEIEIGGSAIMFSDTTADWKAATANLFVYVEDADDCYQKAVNNGAETIMSLSDQDYGRTCGVVDPLGNTWWITSVAANS